MKKYGFVGLGGTFFLFAALIVPVFLSCKETEEDRVKPKTITDIIYENPQFSILKEIVQYTEMSDALRTDELTVFAPSNSAFGKANIFSSASILAMTEDSARIFLQNHIVGQRIDYSEFVAGPQKAKGGTSLTITKVDTTVSVNRSDIVIPDINADNGVIHVIDSVLVNK